MSEVVTSTSNQRVVAAAKLRDRKARIDTGLSLLEGPHVLAAAVDAGVDIETIFALTDTALPACGATVVRVTEAVLGRLAPTEHPRGPVAVFRVEPLAADRPHALVLWDLADPGNVGTLIRTAQAFSLDVIVTPETADVWSPKVVRAGAGSHFGVGFDTVSAVDDLKERDYRVIASVAKGGAWPDEVRVGDHGALLIGNEAHGLPRDVVDAAAVRVSIPMPGGAESFNAGVAGSILAYTLFNG